MEQLCAIFPVVSEIILDNLDDQSLTSLKVVSKNLNNFFDKEKCIPLRKIKKHIQDIDFCSESWNKVVKRTHVDNVKKLAAAVEEFFKPSDFSVTFDVLSPLEIAAHHGCSYGGVPTPPFYCLQTRQFGNCQILTLRLQIQC